MGEVTFTVDGKEITAEKGEVIIAATDRAGVHIPRFCYHPRMKPVGMCRMCLVEVSGPRGMSLQPACFLGVTEGMEVVTDSEKVRKAQDGVLEFLLINHPLDCPVCDKGGECPLQDQTLAYGPGESRFVEAKRHWAKPIALSDLVLLDRERCIQCARCTRFADEIAGEPMIDFLSRGDEIEVAIFPKEKFTSYFSGNTVQICPVGALTSTPYRFAARPWDLEQVESTCTSCGVGCRVVVQSSANEIIRYLGVDADPVNQSWMCDKGRYDFGAQRGASRVTHPMIRRDGELVEASWADALREAADGIRRALDSGADPNRAVGVVGGARLANEDAYAWSKLTKSVIGTDSVDAQLGDGLPAELVLGLPKASFDEVCAAPVVLVAAGDLREEAPVFFLRLKAAAESGRCSIVEVSTLPTALTPYATASLRVRPGESAALLAALVAESDPKPPAAGMEVPPVGGVPVADLRVARALVAGSDPLAVVIGRPSLAEGGEVAAAAAGAVARARPDARFVTVLRRANTHGALDAGLAPGLLPGRVSLDDARAAFEEAWGSVPAGRGLSAPEILREAAHGSLGALILLGADPADDLPDHQSTEALTAGTFTIAVTAHLTASAWHADVILPAAMYGERGGTTTSFEGRVTTLAAKVTPPGVAWEDWVIASELAGALGSDLGFESFEDIAVERERAVPAFRHLTPHVWSAPGARDGLFLPITGRKVDLQPTAHLAPRPIDPMATPGIGSLPHHQARPPRLRIPATEAGSTGPDNDGGGSEASPGRGTVPTLMPVAALREVEVPAQTSYSLRLVSPRALYDRGTHLAASPHLAPLAAVGVLRVNHYDLDRLGATTGDTLRASGAGRSVEVVVEIDDRVPRGVAVIGFNLPPADGSAGAAALIDAGALVNDIQLEAR